MKEKQEFELSVAKYGADELLRYLRNIALEIEIVGSIRRGNKIVHDIDIVMIPTHPIVFENKIIKGTILGIPFEIYIADEDTFEVIKLIRTGSKEFNQKLCMIAKSNGWKLHADGQGLEKPSPDIAIQPESEWITTEREILEELLGSYVEPKDRD